MTWGTTPMPPLAEGNIGAGDLERGHFRGAERDQGSPSGAVMPGRIAVSATFFGADLDGESSGGSVDRMGERVFSVTGPRNSFS